MLYLIMTSFIYLVVIFNILWYICRKGGSAMNIAKLPNKPLYTDMAYINGNWKYYTMDIHSHGVLTVFPII